MDKYCKEASLKYFEKCLIHFENWNNTVVKLENALGKLNASSHESKRLEMQISGFTENLVDDEAEVLAAQVARESRALVVEVRSLELTIEELDKIYTKIISIPFQKVSDIDIAISILFKELHLSVTKLTKLLRGCLGRIRMSDFESFENIREATKIITNPIDLFKRKLEQWKYYE